MIPKRLHFTWKTTSLPPVLQGYYDSFVRFHPEWEITLWTDASMREFVVNAYPHLLAIYDSYPRNVQRADFFRFAVLYSLGGVYADLDIEAYEPIDELLRLDCFAAVEPFEHMGEHRRLAGISYLLCNAFMGSEAGHPLWREMLDLAPITAVNSADNFQSTGPFLLLAAALRLPKDQRPVAILPEVWSPTIDGGRATHTSVDQVRLVERKFDVFRGAAKPLVSHKWMSLWASWTAKHQHIFDRYSPHRLKWWLRSKRYRQIASVTMPLTKAAYDDQRLEERQTERTIHIGLHLPHGEEWNADLSAQLAELDYPRERLSVAMYGAQGQSAGPLAAALGKEFGSQFEQVETDQSEASLHNLIFSHGAASADRVLFVDGSLARLPSDALILLVNSGPELVTATLPRSKRPDAYRYGHRLTFRNLYKAGARSGVLSPDRNGRHEPREWPAFRLLPVDGLSARFLLADSALFQKGVRFAETPYKFHLDGEGLALMAKDLGYEAAIRNDILVE